MDLASLLRMGCSSKEDDGATKMQESADHSFLSGASLCETAMSIRENIDGRPDVVVLSESEGIRNMLMEGPTCSFPSYQDDAVKKSDFQRSNIEIVDFAAKSSASQLAALADEEGETCEYNGGQWVCRPYKKDELELQMEKSKAGIDRRVAILTTLRQLGVKVFVVDGTQEESTRDLMRKVLLVVDQVARENATQPWSGPLGYLRCLLYQDSSGRLFNLTFPAHSVGPLARWQEYLDNFSATQAIIALMILSRSFSCATEGKIPR
jgi:hypothetical protein